MADAAELLNMTPGAHGPPTEPAKPIKPTSEARRPTEPVKPIKATSAARKTKDTSLAPAPVDAWGQEHHAFEHDWDSPAYEQLIAHGLLRTNWRKSGMEDLDFRKGNTTPTVKWCRQALACVCCPLQCLLNSTEVPAGSLTKMQDGRGGFEFLGNGGKYQGIHSYWDCWMRIESGNIPIMGTDASSGKLIVNGDRCVVVVPQGFVGMAHDMGQPVLLPPGMHQWQSPTMKFDRIIDLNQPVIEMGPYTLLTVDKGYEAVTQNNGKQEVLSGGRVHLLNHRNWKFEKFMTCKIQTDDLKRVEVMTGDNVLMHVDATVCWSVDDVQRCAERAAETMAHQGGKDANTILKLRNDVLKQAEASLSALVGKVNFSSTFSAATALQVGIVPTVSVDARGGSSSRATEGVPIEPADAAALLFDLEKLSDAVTHANEMTCRYGVGVLSINIISAKPSDTSLMQSLAKGAVAAAEAQQLQTIARGTAKAATIEAKGAADALKISAQAQAEAEVTRAEGSKLAATLLNEQDVAVQLAMINATGEALKNAKSNLIIGDQASNMGTALLTNSDYTRGMFNPETAGARR